MVNCALTGSGFDAACAAQLNAATMANRIFFGI
jgi:hypothetical protein